MYKLIIIASSFLLFTLDTQARIIEYQIKSYSSIADNLMGNHGENGLYVVPLRGVDHYLHNKYDIKRKSVKLIARRLIPGKTFVTLAQHYMMEKDIQEQSGSARSLFAHLHEEKTHTYVILDDRLLFTESTSEPKLEGIKDKLTKHYVICGQKKLVNYSGELKVYINHQNQEVFAIFDNSSGTYQPLKIYLPALQELLDLNFNDDGEPTDQRLYVLTKNFDQQIDKQKLFAHQAEPFLVK